MKEELKFKVSVKNPETKENFLKRIKKEREIKDKEQDEVILSEYQETISEIESVIVDKAEAEDKLKEILKDKNKTYVGAWVVETEADIKAKEIKLAKRKEIFKEVEGEEQADSTGVIFTEINKLAETIEAIISENPDLMKNKVIKENATLFGKIKEIRKG